MMKVCWTQASEINQFLGYLVNIVSCPALEEGQVGEDWVKKHLEDMEKFSQMVPSLLLEGCCDLKKKEKFNEKKFL